jgi:hypothetical protein
VDTLIEVMCTTHGARLVEPIAPVGPTLTRPRLHVIIRIEDWDMELWSANPGCDHYVTYAPGGGVMCARCPGWYCS